MKKFLSTLLFCIIAVTAFSQWRPHNPNGLVYTDTLDRNIIVSPRWLQIDDIPWVTVILYDSIGHPIREFTNLGLRDDEEEIAYRIIYNYIIKVNGWVRFGNIDIPTMKKQEDDE